MKRLGWFFIIVGAVGVFVVLGTELAIPILEPLFCHDNDTLIRIASPTEDTDRGDNVEYFCVDSDNGERVNVHAKLVFVILLLLVPIPAKLFFGGSGDKAETEAIHAMSESVQSDSPLQDKLSQLQEAYDAGLIDRAEYDLRKDQILDDLVGD